MRRAVLYPLTCTLALATAVALLGAAVALGGAPLHDDPRVTTEAAVRRFYAAANAAIRTGDAAALAAAVATDLVDHVPAPGVASDRAGLERYLVSLHAASPGTELVVEDIVAAGDRALARVTVRGAGRGGFLGMPLAAGRPLWSTVDAWRVADGRVTERWGSADGLALLEPLGRAAPVEGLPTYRAVALERLVVPPGGRLAPEFPDEALVVRLEAGALAVSVAPDSPGSALLALRAAGGRPQELRPGGATTLAAGDLLALPPLTAYALRNEGTVAAEALVAEARRPGTLVAAGPACDPANPVFSPACATRGGPADQRADESPAVSDAARVTALPLVAGPAAALPPGPVAVAIGRATLAPGAELSVPGLTGRVLLSVEAGSLALRTEGGEAWVGRGAGGEGGDRAESTLRPGDGAQLQPGTAVSLRNSGQEHLEILVLTILPDGAPAPWPADG